MISEETMSEFWKSLGHVFVAIAYICLVAFMLVVSWWGLKWLIHQFI